MKESKYFIVCLDKDKAINIVNNILNKDDSLSVAPMFTTDNTYEHSINENHLIYIDPNIINLSYKNNALLFILTSNFVSYGITIDDFYNSDICIMTPKEFNMISNKVFNHNDIIIIWIDTKNSYTKLSNIDNIDISTFFESIENFKNMYFIEGEPNIEDIIIQYIYGSEEEREKIIEENK